MVLHAARGHGTLSAWVAAAQALTQAAAALLAPTAIPRMVMWAATSAYQAMSTGLTGTTIAQVQAALIPTQTS